MNQKSDREKRHFKPSSASTQSTMTLFGNIHMSPATDKVLKQQLRRSRLEELRQKAKKCEEKCASVTVDKKGTHLRGKPNDLYRILMSKKRAAEGSPANNTPIILHSLKLRRKPTKCTNQHLSVLDLPPECHEADDYYVDLSKANLTPLDLSAINYADDLAQQMEELQVNMDTTDQSVDLSLGLEDISLENMMKMYGVNGNELLPSSHFK